VIDPRRKQQRRAIGIAAHRHSQQPVLRNAVQTFEPSGVYVRTALSRSTSASVGLGQGRNCILCPYLYRVGAKSHCNARDVGAAAPAATSAAAA
jgi:hypothetical protein